MQGGQHVQVSRKRLVAEIEFWLEFYCQKLQKCKNQYILYIKLYTFYSVQLYPHDCC